MAFKRLSMHKIHRALRRFCEAGVSIRAIARSIQASPSTLGEYTRRAKTARLSWPLPEKLDGLLCRLRSNSPSKAPGEDFWLAARRSVSQG